MDFKSFDFNHLRRGHNRPSIRFCCRWSVSLLNRISHRPPDGFPATLPETAVNNVPHFGFPAVERSRSGSLLIGAAAHHPICLSTLHS
jgi:hypothetical protein